MRKMKFEYEQEFPDEAPDDYIFNIMRTQLAYIILELKKSDIKEIVNA